jgi:hypothetical protein
MRRFDLKKFLAERKIVVGEFERKSSCINTPEAIERLRSSHVNYFPPSQGPFRCGNCKFYQATTPTAGFCNHPEVRACVEADGCCNEFLKKEW